MCRLPTKSWKVRMRAVCAGGCIWCSAAIIRAPAHGSARRRVVQSPPPAVSLPLLVGAPIPDPKGRTPLAVTPGSGGAVPSGLYFFRSPVRSSTMVSLISQHRLRRTRRRRRSDEQLRTQSVSRSGRASSRRPIRLPHTLAKQTVAGDASSACFLVVGQIKHTSLHTVGIFPRGTVFMAGTRIKRFAYLNAERAHALETT